MLLATGQIACAYAVADHTTENMIIIPIVRKRDTLKPNLNKVKILCTTHYKNVADVGSQIQKRLLVGPAQRLSYSIRMGNTESTC